MPLVRGSNEPYEQAAWVSLSETRAGIQLASTADSSVCCRIASAFQSVNRTTEVTEEK